MKHMVLTYILLCVTYIGIYVGVIAPSVNKTHNISSGGGKHAASRKQNNDGTYCCSSYTYTDTYWLFVETLLHAKVQLQQWVSTFALVLGGFSGNDCSAKVHDSHFPC